MFVTSRFHTAAQKEKLFKSLTKFILEGCMADKFTKALYRQTMNMFGFIAHYDRNGFISEYFETQEGKLEFLNMIRRWPCYGDNSFTLSDVEREIQSWLAANFAYVLEAISEGSTSAPVNTVVPMPWQQVSQRGVATLCTKPMNSETEEAVSSAIHGFGYILPRGKVVSFKTFADMIVQHCSDPRASYIAESLRKAG